MRVDVAKLYAEAERERGRLIAIAHERRAERYMHGVEMAVLGAMLTRYEFELFADVEVDDFFAMAHKCVFSALRKLEHDGRDCEGEFLLVDVGAELARVDREQGKHVRATVTDAFLRELVEPPRWVVPCRDPGSISRAIDQLRCMSIARAASPLSAHDAVDIAARMRRLAGELGATITAPTEGDQSP